MKKEEYKKWLESQKYQTNTINAQMYRAGIVEEYYGDLDKHVEADQLSSVISELVYTTDDKRKNKPNPSKIKFDGDIHNNLASYRDAAKRYLKFRSDKIYEEFSKQEGTSLEIKNVTQDEDIGQRIGLERDMQAALRIAIDQLEKGLTIIDEGVERSVDSGFIDITAKDESGAVVVIELKTGTAGQRAIAQILSYMGDMVSEENGTKVRGILVAGEFDQKAKAAAKIIPTLSLRKYSVKFSFTDGHK
jgi:RecB family endonuclease NucS